MQTRDQIEHRPSADPVCPVCDAPPGCECHDTEGRSVSTHRPRQVMRTAQSRGMETR